MIDRPLLAMTASVLRRGLENPAGWSLQGFGMLRFYLSREWRLHVWDRRYATPEVSTIHDHPWDFCSTVVCGSMRNIVYGEYHGEPNHMVQRIVCGPGGCADGDPYPTNLKATQDIVLHAGEEYWMEATDLHESVYETGTVTLVERHFREDTEHARVCFPRGLRWITAEPRPATGVEVFNIATSALEKIAATLRQEEEP